MEKLCIGLLGLGQIGSAVYSVLQKKRGFLKKTVGVDFEIVKVAEPRLRRARELGIPSSKVAANAMAVIRDPSVDVIVELIGGTQTAHQVVLEALRSGKHVVTANKALLAERGDDIFRMAAEKRRWILFEASVGGGIPVLKALRQGLVCNRIESIHSIINGTSNYILTKMSEGHMDFEEALKEAQAKGYAEANPALDLNGTDAAHKLAILIRFAFGGKVKFSDVYCEGIEQILREDVEFAEELGYRIKLLAIAKKAGEAVEARVQPTLLSQRHILANVRDSFNAVLFRGDEVGDALFYGRGAGPHPTASAVISDLVDIAKREGLSFKVNQLPMRWNLSALKIKSMPSIESRYYLRFHAMDRPGVLSRIAKVLGAHAISISDCVQKGRSVNRFVPLIMITHHAHERGVRAAIRAIDRLKVVRGKSQVLRIEEQ